MPATILVLAPITAAFLVAFSALLLLTLLDRRQASRLRRFSEAERDSIVFIFDNERLLDATPAARQLLDTVPRTGSVWAHLTEVLGRQFPRLSDRITDLADMGTMDLRSTDGASRLTAEWHDGVARLTLKDEGDDDLDAGIDRQSYIALTLELESLRTIADYTPHALWRETGSGAVTWCNRVYLTLAESMAPDGESGGWPPVKVFELSEATIVPSNDEETGAASHRIAIAPDGSPNRHWFDVSVATLPTGDRFCTALPADRLVQAETTHKEFVTTLTKTFADLPIGLAIFDRARELALFNPALMDLTVLPADFLISKPSLSAFLDRLREARMIPEPKDYKSWRQQMSDLVAAAQNGSYAQTWSLPTGQIYRVTGRPHPDGAVAFLFEDISAEITVSRRFRAEIETGQAVLDALPDAVAVFSPAGVFSMSNTAYARLWDRDPSTTLQDITLSDALASWQSTCAPSPVWGQISSFVARSGPRDAWQAQIARLDGRTLGCSVTPLPGGATMIAFADPDARSGSDKIGDHGTLKLEATVGG